MNTFKRETAPRMAFSRAEFRKDTRGLMMSYLIQSDPFSVWGARPRMVAYNPLSLLSTVLARGEAPPSFVLPDLALPELSEISEGSCEGAATFAQ
ncbi:9779_t:CDS:2 [Paraglomus brasilianum]|uniref:9779_t:CDS:1 n=1 Tax=Paraglomus brasilianum TaxID=144538 RepID=A0A9N9GF64_9GLOM|nr:9779_t:CDS:2 [Paraglomus brasilianum]